MAFNKTVSRIGISENLPNGSTYDILLVTVSDGYPVGEVKFQFEETPRSITGIQKVAQLFMKTLFTQKGTDLLYFNNGTNFPELCLGANRTSNDASFLTDVTTAIKDAEAQTVAMTASLSGDLASQLDKVVIQGMNVDTESLSMYIQLVTQAGETASIAIPFPELDLTINNG